MKIDTYTKHEKKALITYAKLRMKKGKKLSDSSALSALLSIAAESLEISLKDASATKAA